MELVEKIQLKVSTNSLTLSNLIFYSSFELHVGMHFNELSTMFFFTNSLQKAVTTIAFFGTVCVVYFQNWN